jgi:5-methylcytosine-specific restriction endonuclease McrA
MGHQTKTYAELFEKLANMALKKLDPMEKKSSPVPEMESLSRYIPKEVKTAVWKRDQGKCTHPGCNSNFGLQYEHIIPFAKGGKTSFENLRLLCPAHNQLSAIQAYGLQKMRTYLMK